MSGADRHAGVEFHRRQINDRFVEFRLVLPLNEHSREIGDYSLHGLPARERLAKFMLASASGIAESVGAFDLTHSLHDLWQRLRNGFAAERERDAGAA